MGGNASGLEGPPARSRQDGLQAETNEPAKGPVTVEIHGGGKHLKAERVAADLEVEAVPGCGHQLAHARNAAKMAEDGGEYRLYAGKKYVALQVE